MIARRISPRQLEVFREMLRGKRVLDVGVAGSPFLAAEFARYAARWTVVGRPPPQLHAPLPSSVTVWTHPYDAAGSARIRPDDFDLVLFAFPPLRGTQEAACLEDVGQDQSVVVFGLPDPDASCGSLRFWQLAEAFERCRDDSDAFSRMLVMRRPRVEEDEDKLGPMDGVEGRRYPQKGERYRLVPSFRWPGKRPGERPPIVEITRDWTRGMGPAKAIGLGEVWRLRRSDLGQPL
ncbi:MAG: hypothetical protein HUU04_00020 [Verrucomicrobiae bacterium]|nr:hypothetical protein [Verrucomicrobiae bacterium]